LVGDVEDIEYLEKADEAQDSNGGGAEDRSHGAELGGAMEVMGLPVRAGAHLSDKEEDDALENEEDDEDSKYFGELGLEEGDDVIVPVVFDCLKDAFVLRDDGLKEHDNGVSLSEEDS
jgi:hypothetical protein